MMFVLCEDQYRPGLGNADTPADIIRQIFILGVWTE